MDSGMVYDGVRWCTMESWAKDRVETEIGNYY